MGDEGKELPNDEGQVKERIATPDSELRRSLDFAKAAIGALSDFAVQNGARDTDLSHIDKIWNEESFHLLPRKLIKKGLEEAGRDSESASLVSGLTARKTGDVFIPEEDPGNTHTVIHESIHRASYSTGEPNKDLLERQVAEECDFRLTDKGTLDPNSPYFRNKPNDDNELKLWGSFVGQVASQLREGLTEWAAQRAEALVSDRGFVGGMVLPGKKYPDQVDWIEKMKKDFQQKSGTSEHEADAVFIHAALSGNISRIANGIGKNLSSTTFRGYLNQAYFDLHHI